MFARPVRIRSLSPARMLQGVDTRYMPDSYVDSSVSGTERSYTNDRYSYDDRHRRDRYDDDDEDDYYSGAHQRSRNRYRNERRHDDYSDDDYDDSVYDDRDHSPDDRHLSRPKTGPMHRVLDEWFEDEDYAPGGRLIVDKRQHANWQGQRFIGRSQGKEVFRDIRDNAETAREKNREVFHDSTDVKKEGEESIKRNLHVWSQWRTMVNDVVSDPYDDDYGHEALPEFDDILKETSAVDTDHNIHQTDPISLMKYSVTTNAATTLDPESYLHYGIPRAEVNLGNEKMRNLHKDYPHDPANQMKWGVNKEPSRRSKPLIVPPPGDTPTGSEVWRRPLKIPRPTFQD